MKPKLPTAIFHSCAVDNLPSVLKAGGLWAKAFQEGQAIAFTNVAHSHIQDRRAKTTVPCGPGGVLHEYVPFYFNPRSPMLYAIHKGKVEDCQVCQREMIHLVAYAQDVAGEWFPFAFSDGHGTMGFTRFFEDLSELDKLDWAVLRDKDFRDTDRDGDRKRRRQAEFLVHRFLPFKLIRFIAVMDPNMQNQVTELLSGLAPQPRVITRSDLFFL